MSILRILGMILGAALTSMTPLTPEAALARVIRPPWSQERFPTKEEVAESRGVIEAAAAREPASLQWSYGLAHVTRLEGDLATGDDAVAKRKETRTLFEKVVERAPGNAEYQYWLGDSCFEMIDDVGLLSKASTASKGRGALEKAIEIDPGYVAARYALGTFFSKAPGIAGGSTAKAKAQGQALLALPNGKGDFWGRILLAEIAAADKDWEEMSKQYAAAESAKGEGANPAGVLRSHAFRLLNEKKDPAAALPVVARYRAVAKPDDTSPDFFEGEVRRQMGQWAEAVAAYEKVLAKNPEARNTRYAIAECYEKLGTRAEAKKHYEEFERRFPKDERAAKAREAAKRLG